jgi:hypothetical protein
MHGKEKAYVYKSVDFRAERLASAGSGKGAAASTIAFAVAMAR